MTEVKFLIRIAKVLFVTCLTTLELLKMMQYIEHLIRSHVPRSIGESQVDEIIFSRVGCKKSIFGQCIARANMRESCIVLTIPASANMKYILKSHATKTFVLECPFSR